MKLSRRFVGAAVVAATVATASAGAQAFSPTGASQAGGLDLRWNVSCTTVGSVGQPNCPVTAAAFTPATVITATPAGWHAVPTSDGAYYIGVNQSGTLFGGSPDEVPHYQYVFQTAFDAPGGAGQTLGFNLFAFDNYFMSGTLNGNAITITPNVQGNTTGGYWASTFDLTGANGLQNTGNQLVLTVQGNGRTDGILVDGYSVTPEPSSFALLGTGLFGLVPMIRRRKQK